MNSTTKTYLHAVLTSYFIILTMSNYAIAFINRLKLAKERNVEVTASTFKHRTLEKVIWKNKDLMRTLWSRLSLRNWPKARSGFVGLDLEIHGLQDPLFGSLHPHCKLTQFQWCHGRRRRLSGGPITVLEPHSHLRKKIRIYCWVRLPGPLEVREAFLYEFIVNLPNVVCTFRWSKNQ